MSTIRMKYDEDFKKPGIVAASGNLKHPTHSLHRDEAAVFLNEAELVLYDLKNRPTDFFRTSMVSGMERKVAFHV